MASVVVLSNPFAAGNKSDLDRLRTFCAGRTDVIHIEVPNSDQTSDALTRVAAIRPQALVINGGDGTVQTVLTALFRGGYFDAPLPALAVLPNGTTNIIAKDLGATGDPIRALERVLKRVGDQQSQYRVTRELIALTGGREQGPPEIGMFLAGGALAETLIYCREKIYPLGLPNGVSHLLTVMSVIVSVLTGMTTRFLPPKPSEADISVGEHVRMRGRFQVLMVTTLERLLLSGKAPIRTEGALQLVAIERRPMTVLRSVVVTLLGRLGRREIPGVHLKTGKEIRIDAERATVIMDGEMFVAERGRPIVLRLVGPVGFLDLSA